MGSAYYDEPGDCGSCPILGCPDRKCGKDSWWSSDTDYDRDIRQQDIDYPDSGGGDNRIRRARIEDCKRLRVDTDYSPRRKQKRIITVHEYFVRVQWHYDVMPQNKHTKEETVYEQNSYDAHDVVQRMYPNSTILNSRLGEQNIQKEIE